MYKLGFTLLILKNVIPLFLGFVVAGAIHSKNYILLCIAVLAVIGSMVGLDTWHRKVMSFIDNEEDETQ